MKTLAHFVFFGIPQQETLSPELISRVNIERAKVYFGNTTGSLRALTLGLILADTLLIVFHVSMISIALWSCVLLASGVWVYRYETSILKQGFCPKRLVHQVSIRLLIGFVIAWIWGFFAELMPCTSMIGYTLSFIAMSTFINIGMLSFSVLPMQYYLYCLGAILPLELKLCYNFVAYDDSLYLILAIIFLLCQLVLLKRALTNSHTAIRAIILNEQLKDEIQKYTEAQEHITFLAYHDQLTNVWNRHYIETHLRSLAARSETTQTRFGVILIDINRFKPINDTYGHHYGDDLLVQFTQNLQQYLTPQNTLARLGGDEFIIVCENASSLEDLEAYAQTLKQALNKTYTLHDVTLKNSASIGCALFPDDAQNINTLIHIADKRMYRDKRKDALLDT